jgi:hypothetical protein
MPWPKQYLAGKGQMESLFQREKAQAAALSPVRAAES